MALSPKIRLSLLMAGIFLAGAVVGGLATQRWVREAVRRPAAPERISPMIVRHWIRPLDLSAEQAARIQPLVEHSARQLAETRRDSLRRSQEILRDFEREVSRELTAGQREQFRRILAERRERMKRTESARPVRGAERPPEEQAD